VRVVSALVTVAPLAIGSVAAAGWAISARTGWQLRRLLRTDRLTGLANRDALLHAFARATRPGRCGAVGVLLLDLDGFKQVNDTYGHAVGDAVLRHVADRLADAARPWGGLPVRLHGDEFAVLLPDLPLAAGPDMVGRCVAEVVEAVRTPLIWVDVAITAAASVGTAIAPVRHADLSALLRVADQRMYGHKQRASAGEGSRGGSRAPLRISQHINALAGTRAPEGHRG
jgi:diguanylate cyclase (GGDEF)-like protein